MCYLVLLTAAYNGDGICFANVAFVLESIPSTPLNGFLWNFDT